MIRILRRNAIAHCRTKAHTILYVSSEILLNIYIFDFNIYSNTRIKLVLV